MAYTLIRSASEPSGLREDMVRRDSDGAFIPSDPENHDWLAYEAWLAAGNQATVPLAAEVTAPDNPTLSDWRCGLTLWKRPDGTLRINEVTQEVAALVASGNPLGLIARERLERANNVLRAQLVQLAPLFGFSGAEIEESLWRAERVRLGDLSGKWPL